jgi:hypothetical protein
MAATTAMAAAAAEAVEMVDAVPMQVQVPVDRMTHSQVAVVSLVYSAAAGWL